MQEDSLIRRQREVIQDLIRLAAERDRAEVETEQSRSSRDAAADQEYQAQKQAILQRYEARKEKARLEDEARRKAIVEAAVAGEVEAKSEFGKASRRIATEFEHRREQIKATYQQTKWEVTTAFEASQRGAAERFAETKARLDEAIGLWEGMQQRLAQLFFDYKKFGLNEAPATPTREDYSKFDDPIAKLYDRLAKADEDLAYLEGLAIPKALKGWRDLWIFVLVFAVVIYPLASAVGAAVGVPLALVVAIALGFVLRRGLHSIAHKQVAQSYDPLAQAMTDAGALAEYCQGWVEATYKARQTAITQKRDDELNKAKKKQSRDIEQAEAHRDEQIRQINEVYTRRMTEIQATQQRDMKAAVEEYERLAAEIETQYAHDSQALEERYRSLKASIRSRYEAAWNSLETKWREGLGRAAAVLEEVRREVARSCPDWQSPDFETWTPPAEVPPVLRFGEITIGLDQIPQGLPRDERLRRAIPTSFTFPALLTFPDHGNLLIETTGEGRPAAVQVLQALMMRLLTSLPPGKVRFTIIDPVGLGRNFGAFMHLADFDEALVNHRIWTEPQQIEQRLADLSEHMEKVLQKYLRNEYETIEEYNAKAGEVAEPFRVLVVADFPANFEERSARRLANILASGIRCGVLALVAVDRDRELPESIKLPELRAHAANLIWNSSRLVWQDPDFGVYPLRLDAMPPAEVTTRVLQEVGSAAKIASRVEVPFEFIAPKDGAYWTGDSRAGIDIALGKAGATKKQPLLLGKGTSQHVLVAGRTGSGKSTLLHALITNLALTYSPDEIELYLIDFKKGVEFKTYATHELPHARVVAIESEREFGISVLQRLDGLLKERAELFRQAGVQDLNGYRNADGAQPLPRVLLIVDEFQEFFVEDDKIAQEASLLLDRLVRQGRAFGVHVILGSQTLSGAYSLARSTIGQMAVRIALQCSESDAHLILSEENSAAKLLSRPGEAVYNDANGMVEGNHFFQVVWLGEERRDLYLNKVSELTRQRRPILARRPIVFEGNTGGRIEANPLLNGRLSATGWPASPRSALAWLGDAVAIKDPTAAIFRRQGGSHLLIVGQNDEAALGIMMAALLSFAVQFPPPESDTTRSGAKFYVLEGTPEDSSLSGRLSQLAEALPHPVSVGAWRDVPRIVGAVAEEVERRQQPDSPEGPELFLFIHDISRFRDLRKREDDFSFSRRDEPASPADQLGTILREGPVLGVHVLTWCDNLNNLNRTFDRQTLREFEQRVLFQMSPTDSSHLIDSPLASRLGPNRALYSSEEEGVLEKFRPYGLPPEDWLAWAREQFQRLSEALSQRQPT
ncbi:MAG: AAA family ATPase [Isosphaeraceae bacterium]|nr:AAA family ATPase [Isosphaeraceae bacterium]